jgi:lipopolysaccharide/colanic/teichoic acid biosynthesis glycosyltransferase
MRGQGSGEENAERRGTTGEKTEERPGRRGADASVPPSRSPSTMVMDARPRPATPVAGAHVRRVRAALKRGVDIVVAAFVLVATLPVTALVVVAIKIESSGPIFYHADRVGRGGRSLSMVKFRKMRLDAQGPRLTLAEDRRLTRVGAFLARTKLDELPQFFNVLRGDMSLIGPRPEDPSFVAQRARDYDVILRVRPGITGFSQIAFANENGILSTTDPEGHYLERIFPQKCALDRLYVQTLSLRTDLRVLAWTVIAVFLRRPVAVDRSTGAMRLRRRPGSQNPRGSRSAAVRDPRFER